MDQAGVLSRPAKARRRGQRTLHHRPGVHVGPRLKFAELRVQHASPRLFIRFSSTL